MGEVVGLSLDLIYLYVPALTPRLHWGETALHLSENITLFGICCIIYIYIYIYMYHRHYSVQNLLSSRLIPKSLNIKIHRTVILPVLRKIFGPKREEDGSWGKLRNDELYSRYPSEYWTNCAFGLYPSSGVSRTNKIEELKIIDKRSQYTRPLIVTCVWLASKVYVCVRPVKLHCG
jgi:hypothetical protein